MNRTSGLEQMVGSRNGFIQEPLKVPSSNIQCNSRAIKTLALQKLGICKISLRRPVWRTGRSNNIEDSRPLLLSVKLMFRWLTFYLVREKASVFLR